ncbi:SWEET family sugar transporter [Weissella confusa]|uniref:SWEET family sugar transporter n=1 Tax=Weissella confusa TaxID=1583 RepID=UPI00223ABC88|nr:SWEET family sugar transporter [Weissella confusa]MCT0009019.1 hypothetical protein [Weissella confusa]MCT0025326.1 hypothetical protein [Weissella confusa]
MEQKKYFVLIGGIASIMAVAMYVSYIPQIAGNLSGQSNDPIQPFVAMVNCIVWTIYGFFGDDGHTRNKPIIVANVPGIFLGFAAFITAII